MYVGGLYLLQANQDPAAITREDQAMAIRLHMVSGMVTRKRMIASIREGFKKSAGARLEALQAYDILDKYFGDPLAAFAAIKADYEKEVAAGQNVYGTSDFEFSKKTEKLIQFLLAMEDIESARMVQKKALEVVDDPVLRSIVP